MRRIPMIHRIISFGLALALFALSPASAFADGEEDIALVGTASIDNGSKEASEASVGETENNKADLDQGETKSNPELADEAGQDGLDQKNEGENSGSDSDEPKATGDAETPETSEDDEDSKDEDESELDDEEKDKEEEEEEEEDVESDGIFYENSAYGSASTSENHLEDLYTVEDGYKEGRYAVKLYNYNYSGGYSLITPSNDKYFFYSDKCDEEFEFHFSAPTNYYIDAVRIADVNTHEVYKEYKPEGSYNKTFDVNIKLQPMGEDKVVNNVVVSICPIPVEWASDGETTVAGGATFVNYKNGIHVFGDQFWFNGGHDGGSNECHFEQVYQGLAVAELDSTNPVFKLQNDTGKAFFPHSDDYDAEDEEYSYITDYRSNVGVQFKKDADGYWTLDSSQSRYVINDENILVPTTGTKQFRPFGDDDHFAMALPIKFCINSDGKTNGKDTIFKFAGDDDVYVYIDNKLVLDLGGIHDIIRGQINFNSGEVLIQGDYNSKLTSSVDNTCYAAKSLGNQNIYSILGTNLSEFSKGEHQLTVVYFERGAYLSNCRISYNFNKDETVNVEYEGLKLDEKTKAPLQGAEFTLYEDAACTTAARDGLGNPLKAVSDEKGSIKFEGISVGIITSSVQTVDKTYYMKETKAAENYVLPENAVWKLYIEATSKEVKSTLEAVGDDAKNISIFDKNAPTHVKAITNKKAPGKLRIVKTLKTFVEAQGTASFVFEVSYQDAGKKYSNVYSYDFNDAGTQKAIEIELPADVEVTVKEIYSGACYKVVGSDTAKKTILPNETVEVKFVNDYDGRTNHGSISITNVFKKITDTVNGIKYKFEKAIEGGMR